MKIGLSDVVKLCIVARVRPSYVEGGCMISLGMCLAGIQHTRWSATIQVSVGKIVLALVQMRCALKASYLMLYFLDV